MPSGDSTRVWFPKMLDELQKQWSNTLSWEECGRLCDRMTAARTKLKLAKGVQGPMMHCRHCNAVHEMSLAPITIRSLLFALRKQGVLSEPELNQLDADCGQIARWINFFVASLGSCICQCSRSALSVSLLGLFCSNRNRYHAACLGWSVLRLAT